MSSLPCPGRWIGHLARMDVIALEQEGWRALCGPDGADFYADLMTPDGVMVLAHGQALDRDQVRESLSQAPPWDEFEILSPRVVASLPGTAILTYRGRARRGDVEFAALMTSVYVELEGRWRLAAYQQTPVPADGDTSG